MLTRHKTTAKIKPNTFLLSKATLFYTVPDYLEFSCCRIIDATRVRRLIPKAVRGSIAIPAPSAMDSIRVPTSNEFWISLAECCFRRVSFVQKTHCNRTNFRLMETNYYLRKSHKSPATSSRDISHLEIYVSSSSDR
jgi:hypothetical protein